MAADEKCHLLNCDTFRRTGKLEIMMRDFTGIVMEILVATSMNGINFHITFFGKTEGLSPPGG